MNYLSLNNFLFVLIAKVTRVIVEIMQSINEQKATVIAFVPEYFYEHLYIFYDN